MQCIMPQNLTTPDRFLGNPLNKGFFEPEQYQRVVERCNDGHELLDLNIEIDEDLLKILKKFSKSLRDWSDRSKRKILNSKEGRTAKAAWRDSIVAMEKYAERNDDVADIVEQKAIKNLKSYETNHYSKKLMQVKKSKEIEKQFKRVQTPWTESLAKINAAKHAYYDAQKKLNDAEVNEQTTKTDLGSTDEQKQKASNNAARRKKELNSCVDKHNSLIKDIPSKKQQYEEEMIATLRKANDFEQTRLAQFKESFTALQEAVSIESDKYKKAIKDAFTNAINMQNPDADIEEFDRTYGMGTKTNWPSFEELKPPNCQN